MSPEDIPARIASANAALAAIHSATPAVPVTEPRKNPKMALTALPQLPGGDIKDTIVFEARDGVPVVDELTAQKSASEFSSYLNAKRATRNELWSLFWRNRLALDHRILQQEDNCFVEAQREVLEYDRDFEEDNGRSAKLVSAPYVINATGSFDVPPPPPVLIPDPEEITQQFHQQSHAQAAQQYAMQQQYAMRSNATRRPKPVV